MNQAEFARTINRSEAYITELKQAGRLVFFPDSQEIDADASVKRMLATKDITKQGVVDHNAEQRGGDTLDFTERNLQASGAYAQARALREKYNALAAKKDYEIAVGNLLHIDEVKFVIAQGDGIIRDRLESLPDILAPQLALEISEVEIKAIVQRHINGIIENLGWKFRELSG